MSKTSTQPQRQPSIRSRLLNWLEEPRSFVFSQVLFLKLLTIIYLIAFTSLYVQIPGLYGRDGILPAKRWLDLVGNTHGTNKVDILPTLLWYSEKILSYIPLPEALQSFEATENFMHILCLFNIVLCLAILVFGTRLLSFWSFLTLWGSYLSLYQVGQTFLSFQWDVFLLETGFLAIFYCPAERDGKLYSDEVSIAMRELLRWLFFRFMFSSGVVKLTSNDPTWWSLTTLDWHFQSQPIPNPVARVFHFLPRTILKFGVVFTYLVEIFHPFAFYIPVSVVRHFLTIFQIIFQLLIILTGNYNFFNLLTIVVSLPLFDDDFLLLYTPKPILWLAGLPYDVEKYKRVKKSSGFPYISTIVLTLLCFGLPLYLYFPWDYLVQGKINFDMRFIKETIINGPFLTYCVYMVIIMYLAEYFRYSVAERHRVTTFIQKIIRGFKFTFVTMFAGYVFLTTIYSFYNSIGARIENTLIPKIVPEMCYKTSQNFHITSGYGVFRTMTGVGGRPEIIIEGSMDGKNWEEYEFFYKPGNVSRMDPQVAPHQPRVDWQMWFAALSDINHQQWLANMLARIFSNSSSVLSLLEKNPFPERPPTYLRISKYKYFFEPFDSKSGSWWRRVREGDYLPAIRAEDMQRPLQQIKFAPIKLSEYPINPMQSIPIIPIILTVLLLNIFNTIRLLRKLENKKPIIA